LPKNFIDEIQKVMEEFIQIPNVSSLYSDEKENLEL